MRCSEVRSLLSDHLDGELTGVRERKVQEHLCRCEACQGEWQSLRQAVRLVGQLGQERCPVDLRHPVMRAVAVPLAEPRWSIRPLRVAAWGGFATTVAALAAVWFVSHDAPPLEPGARAHAPAQAAVVAEASLHDQYDLANGLGSVDGLMLSISKAAPKRQDDGALLPSEANDKRTPEGS